MPVPTPAPDSRLRADPLVRALAIFVAGMALLLAIDLASEPRGTAGEDRAVEAALAAGSEALGEIADPAAPAAQTDPERGERARSAAFFLEQARIAWRRGEETGADRMAAEQDGASLLALLGKLWMLGWLLLPLGALAARIACPASEGRAPHWALIYAASSLGGSAGLVALALAIHALGASAPVVIAPLASAIVVLNAWLLREHARLDRAATLLRLAPLLVILAVLLVLVREIALRLAILP